MCPPLFGCRTNTELCRVRGWDKNLPSRLLGALPKRSWLKRLRRLGLEVLVPLWRYAASKSEATRSRWQWTWVGDDSVFKKYGEQLGLVGTWWSGVAQRFLPHRTRHLQPLNMARSGFACAPPGFGSAGNFHIPPHLVVERVTTQRKPPEVRIELVAGFRHRRTPSH